MKIRPRFLLVAAILSTAPWTCAIAAPGVVTDRPDNPLKSEQIMPVTTLRGYGKVSGHFYQFAKGSILEIACESEDKAKLLQAKYLSDAGLLPGVKPAGSQQLPGALEISGEGTLAAARAGASVYVLEGASTSELEGIAKTLLSGVSGELATTAEATVPAWLDKWDKYGFRQTTYDIERMYMPKGSDRNTFDFFKPMEWNKQVGIGLAVDPVIGHEDFGEGISSQPYIDWMENACAELGIAFNFRSIIPKVDATQMWFANRYINDMQVKAPYYVGNFYTPTPDPGWGNNSRTLAWSAGDVEDEILAIVQKAVRATATNSELINYNYPQQEVAHGYHDIFCEYGPVADVSYRDYLKKKYGSIDAVSRRWYGAGGKLVNWRSVRVPEAAEFEGWSSDAINIDGLWKVKRLEKTEEPPADWNTPGCADEDWEGVRTPGDWMMFGGYKSPGNPAVFRIRFDVPGEWLKNHSPHQWLYVWDVNPWDSEMAYSVNGAPVVHDKGWPYVPHWVAVDVTGNVKAGSNQLALLLSRGYVGYRVYLSGEAPRMYPYLGRGDNARWVDFMDWRTECRAERIRRGVEAIRQIDPDRPVTLDAPHYLLDAAREIAIDLGCVLHDTGGLAGSWNDHEQLLTQGADLPYSLEYGNGPHTANEFETVLGRCLTENVQSIESVTPDSSSLYYDPEIRKRVEEYLPLTNMVGKYHVPPAKVGYFMSSRDVEMLAYPWRPDASKVVTMGYYGWFPGVEYPAAGVMESDFLKNRAGKYAVIVDTNTQIIDAETLAGIERYVRNGGVFVTVGQTGRHSELDADSWPISRLTGYKVTGLDAHYPDGGERPRPGGLDDPLPGNGIFQIKHWAENQAYLDNMKYASGLSLEKVAPDCRDLIKWKDGTVAAGIRPLGKGYMIDLGMIFGRYGSSYLMKKLVEDIITWRGVTNRVPGQIYPPVVADPASLPKDLNIVPSSAYLLSAVGAACQHQFDHDFDGFPWAYKGVIFRYYESNNGLYDVWAVYNTSGTSGRTVDLTFRDGLNPAFGYDVKAGKPLSVSHDDGIPQIKGIQLAPNESKMFLTPRRDIARAGLDWFTLQRGWWRTSYVPGKPFPAAPHKLSVDLDDGWSFLSVDGKSDDEIAALAGTGTDDSKWEHRSLGIWTTPKKQDVHHGLLRHWVTIPDNWDKGTVGFWLMSWYSSNFYDHGTVYIDGKDISQPRQQNYFGNDLTATFRPGTRHLVAMDIKADGQLAGVVGDCWLYYTPRPVSRTSLMGQWASSSDMIHYDKTVTLPGHIPGKIIRRQDVTLDPAQKGKNVLLCIDSDSRIHGAIVNGHWVCRFHHCLNPYFELNITPWVNFNGPNDIELTGISSWEQALQTRLVEVRYYKPGTYP